MHDSSEYDAPSLLDEPEQVITDAFDPVELGPIANQLRHSHSQRLWKTVYRKVSGSSREIQGEVASHALALAIHALEQWIRKRAKMYSSLRWLWMLRRVPQVVFEGYRRTTLGYDVALAEVLTDTAPQKPGTRRRTGEFLHYELSAEVIRNLTVHCESVKYLSDLHCAYRWAGKGAKILISPDGSPVSEADDQLVRAVDLYDTRVERFARPFSRLGTILPAGTCQVPSVRLISTVTHSVSKDAMGSGVHPDIDKAPAWILPMRYSVDLVGLDDLFNLGVTSKTDLAALFILFASLLLMHRHHTKFYSVLTRGYLLFDTLVLRKYISDALEILPAPLASALHDANLTSTDVVVSELSNISGSAWPVRVGPVLRHEGEGVCVDLYAATSRLDAIELQARTGSGANARSKHFELAVQCLLDASSWRASKDMADLRGRTLTLNQQKITDIDAIGERCGCLLLVSCKSIAQRADYQTGSHKIIRNAATTLEDAVSTWKEKLAALRQASRGDNFDISRFSSIVGVVCVPAIVWVPVGPAMELVLPGLTAAVSYGELEDWVKNP